MAKKRRGRKKDQQEILCQMTLIEYKKEDCVLITSQEEPRHNIWVSKLWWEGEGQKLSKWKLHENHIQK